MFYSRTGLTLTQTWNTANALDTKIEVADSLAKGLKLEGLFNFLPATAAKGAKFNLHFKQPGFHGRAFFDLLKGPVANVDAVVGHEGFLAGASAGYDANKAALTAYSAAVGYAAPQYSAAITASDNLSVFAASYYHKVNSQVEAGAKATWNSKTGNAVGLEVASKYRIDPVSFTKVRRSEFAKKGLRLTNVPKYRSRSTTVVLLPSPTTFSSARASPLVSVVLSTPKSSTRLPTSSVPASPSRVKLLLEKNTSIEIPARGSLEHSALGLSHAEQLLYLTDLHCGGLEGCRLSQIKNLEVLSMSYCFPWLQNLCVCVCNGFPISRYKYIHICKTPTMPFSLSFMLYVQYTALDIEDLGSVFLPILSTLLLLLPSNAHELDIHERRQYRRR